MKNITSDFYCTSCGKKGVPIIRNHGKMREAGHLKKLFCIHCKKETNHVEIRDTEKYTLEDFKQEFELGRFINGERIEKNKLERCEVVSCPYNVENRCWNANHSFECNYRKENKNEIL